MYDFLKKALKNQLKSKPKPKTSSINTPPKIETKQDASPKHDSLITNPATSKTKADIPHNPQTPINHQDPEKEFLRIFKQLTYRHRSWDIWKDFITMVACALSNPVDKTHYDEREELYLKTIKKYNKQEQAMFPELFAQTVMALELNPEQDFLGGIFMNLNLGNETGGQFFTPYHVCDLMAKISLDDVQSHVEKKGYITINDPCCGAGATLIAGIHEARRQLEKAGLNWQNHVLISAQDIDYTAALMCYIQLSLLGAAAYVKIGNSLTEPMCPDDTLKNYWFTLMYFSDVWATRRLLRGKTLL